MTRGRSWSPTVGAQLTSRQLEYVRRTAAGESWRRIGTALGITVDGVGSISRQVRAKLGALNDAHAVHLAHERGLLGRPPQLRVPQPAPKPGATPEDARQIARRLEATYRKEQHR
jgi:DNA-binding CsgD family transcriptional regulator